MWCFATYRVCLDVPLIVLQKLMVANSTTDIRTRNMSLWIAWIQRLLECQWVAAADEKMELMKTVFDACGVPQGSPIVKGNSTISRSVSGTRMQQPTIQCNIYKCDLVALVLDQNTYIARFLYGFVVFRFLQENEEEDFIKHLFLRTYKYSAFFFVPNIRYF